LFLKEVRDTKSRGLLKKYYNCEENGLLLSKCGKYAVLSSVKDFRVYDTKEKKLEFRDNIKSLGDINQLTVDSDGDILTILDDKGFVTKVKTSFNFCHADNSYKKREKKSNKFQKTIAKLRKEKKLLDMSIRLKAEL